MDEYERISNKEYTLIRYLFKKKKKYGNRKKYNDKLLLNACLYILETGKKWQDMPNCFPNPRSVYSFYQSKRQSGVWQKIMKKLETIRGQSINWCRKGGNDAIIEGKEW